MYLNGRLPKSRKLLRVQLLIPAAGTRGNLSIWSFICFYCYSHGPCIQPAEPTAIPVALATQSLKVLCEVWTHAEKPAKKHCPGRDQRLPLRLFLRNLECHYCSGFPYSSDCSKFLFTSSELGLETWMGKWTMYYFCSQKVKSLKTCFAFLQIFLGKHTF